LLLAILASCAGEVPTTVGDAAYHCADGHVVRVLFEIEQDRAVLTTTDDALTLTRTPAERGARFTALGGWEFWVEGDQALFTFPGGQQTVCTYAARS
jgi:hypothetical protein